VVWQFHFVREISVQVCDKEVEQAENLPRNILFGG
jgi:hypothetical protein